MCVADVDRYLQWVVDSGIHKKRGSAAEILELSSNLTYTSIDVKVLG